MKPAYPTYLLEVQWVWDHHNTEIATLTIEGLEGQRCQDEYEKLIDPAYPAGQKEEMLRQLKEVAAALNNGVYGSCDLVRLYRIVEHDRMFLLPSSQKQKELRSDSTVEMKFTLRPICAFDEMGEPVPL